MLGACLCFKDSAAYLEEWLLFHYVQGFRKFYLYDNESTDSWPSIVVPWIEKGVVETFVYPGRAVQQEIYDDCLRRACGVVTWLAFVDDDEFLFPTVGGSLDSILAEYEAYAGIAVSWVLFGSGRAERSSPAWVIDRFRASTGIADNHVKCVVRPERVIRSLQIGHSFEPKPGFVIVDENKRPLAESLNSNPTVHRLRINHYLVKSWEEWQHRRGRPQANTGMVTPHSEQQWREWDVSWSQCEDLSALAYLEQMQRVKAELFQTVDRRF
jgi:hypothetical protein